MSSEQKTMIPIATFGASVLAKDDNGKLYQIFPEINPPLYGINIFNPSCRMLCGHDIKRLHFTCLFACRHKKALYGKIPRKIRVEPLTVLVWRDRPHRILKTFLLKKLFNLIEVLAT